MLLQFKLPEALAWLSEETGRQWTDSELFQVCVNRGVPLHAAPPLEAQCVVLEMNPDNLSDVRVAMRLGWRKAILHPWRIGQLWQIGETEPAPDLPEASDSNQHRWAVFDPPVRVTREHLAIELESLGRVARLWRKAEAAARRPQQSAPSGALPTDGPVAGDEIPHWKMQVQAEAAAYWLRLRKSGANPTRGSIRPHLLRWCKENNVKTPGGINPSDGYLRTHVLSGKHWTPPDD